MFVKLLDGRPVYFEYSFAIQRTSLSRKILVFEKPILVLYNIFDYKSSVMKKIYIFANEVEPELRDVSIAVVMFYCAAFEDKLHELAQDVTLEFLAWSARSDEIGEVYKYSGPSKKELYALVDEIDSKLIEEDLASRISTYWRGNFDEFIARTKEIIWSDYGCEKPSRKEFVDKLSRENVAKVLNSIIINLVDE